MMIEKGTCLLAIFSPMQWHAFEFLCVRWWLLRLSCTIHSVSFTLTDSTKLEWKNTHNLIYVWKNAYFVVPSLCFKPYINSCNSRVKAAEADKCRCVCVWRHKRDTQWHNPMNCRCALRWNEWTHFIIHLWFFFFCISSSSTSRVCCDYSMELREKEVTSELNKNKKNVVSRVVRRSTRKFNLFYCPEDRKMKKICCVWLCGNRAQHRPSHHKWIWIRTTTFLPTSN